MIGVIGFRRFLVLVCLVGINAVFPAGFYYHVSPRMTKVETEVRSLESDVRNRQSELVRIEGEFEQIEALQERFTLVKNRGFMGLQDRVVARRRFEDIESLSRILALKYEVQAGVREESPLLEKAGYVLMRSPVSFSIDAFDDIDVYRVIYLLESQFPGYVAIESVEMKRTRRVNDSVLRAVGGGQRVPLVQATVDFSWRTILPASEAPSAEPSRAGGRR